MGEFDNPTTEQQDLGLNADLLQQIRDARNQVSRIDPSVAADNVRQYPGMSPDVAAATVWQPQFGYAPELAETIRADYYGQSVVSQYSTNTLGAITRPLTMFFHDTYDMMISKPLRMAVETIRSEQNRESFSAKDTFLLAGSSMGAQTIRGLSEGTITWEQALTSQQLGTGYIFGRDPNYLAAPGAGRHFQNEMIEGATLEEAADSTEAWVAERQGFDVVNAARNSQEAVRLNVTVNGVHYDTGVSLGRLSVLPAWHLNNLTPGTIPSNRLSGGIDTLAPRRYRP